MKPLHIALLLLSLPLSAQTHYLPVLNGPVPDQTISSGSGTHVIDLSSVFGSEVIDNQVVRFTSHFSGASGPYVIDLALFSTRAPGTRANFLNYVGDGDYNNTFIHRSVPGFVIQGGSYTVSGTTVGSVPTDPPILNEFGISNTKGTVSMAKIGGDPHSATSGFFISTGENSDILDPQNGGFSVFGRVTASTMPIAETFGNASIFPVYNYGAPFSQLPMHSSHVAPNVTAGDFVKFPTAALVPLPAGVAGTSPALTYSVTNSNTAISHSVSGSNLILSYPAGSAGSSTLTVRGIDSVGNEVEDSFVITLSPPSALNRDFDGDGYPDILWRRSTDGATAVHFYEEENFLRGRWTTQQVTAAARIAGIGDFDGDGKADILWDGSGGTSIHFMNAENYLAPGQWTSAQLAAPWEPVGVGDFDGDGKADILYQNSVNRVMAIHYMNAETVLSQQTTYAVGWDIKGVGDFNGDGKADLLLRNPTTKATAYHYLNNGAFAGAASPSQQVTSASWDLIGADDFDRNGTADLLWRNNLDGRSVIHYYDGASFNRGRWISSQVTNSSWFPTLQ